jgi:hypothetical protein
VSLADLNYSRQLPWSTSNEDLVELFETTGSVVLAEILFEGQRSKGSGVVQFKEVGEAEEACLKFTGYVYGGRPLGEYDCHSWILSFYADTDLPRRAFQRSMARVL